MEKLVFWRLFDGWRHRDVICGVGYGEMTCQLVSGLTWTSDVVDMSEQWRNGSWRNADVAMTWWWREDDVEWKGRAVSGIIRLLLVRARFVSEAAQYNQKQTHVHGQKSAIWQYRTLKDGDRGWSEIAEDRRMGGPRSDRRRDAKILVGYGGTHSNKKILIWKTKPHKNFG